MVICPKFSCSKEVCRNHYLVSLTTAPVPTLLNFDIDSKKFQALREENESLKNQVRVNLIAVLLLALIDQGRCFCKGTCIKQNGINPSWMILVTLPMQSYSSFQSTTV